MAELLLGPMLRHVGERDATVWVETDAPCEVDVLGHTERTFCVEGHYYALVGIDDLEPGRAYEYEVKLDGERRWPTDDSEFPASRIRSIHRDHPMEIAFGSCRVTAPHHPPYSLSKDQHGLGAEVDALRVRGLEMRRQPPESWPDQLLLLGDQVYVDEGSPRARQFIRSRRDTSQPPGEGPLDFEEYRQLYLESWSEPVIRWLFANVPAAMIIDDHDIHDDWNISRSWLEEMRSTSWWDERIRAGAASYWIYQHFANLSPEHLAEEETYRKVQQHSEDATAVLREYGDRCADDRQGIRWSYRRDFGRTRLIVMDSRGGRVLQEGKRSIFDDREREWIWEQARGDFDHLLLATSDPFLLAHGLQYLEAWNEAVCNGAWGSHAARVAERVRRAVDLDHWGAFQLSFHRLVELIRAVGSGELGNPPASIVVLSGDVHHAYLVEVGFARGSGVKSPVYQAVCSPYRNPLDSHERLTVKAAASRPGWAAGRILARAAGVDPPEIGWRFLEGPLFDNQIASLTLDGQKARMTLSKTEPGEPDEARLASSFERTLT